MLLEAAASGVGGVALFAFATGVFFGIAMGIVWGMFYAHWLTSRYIMSLGILLAQQPKKDDLVV